jgi:hypothetical protein
MMASKMDMILKKVERIEDKLDKVHEEAIGAHTQAKVTNGKVRLHEKLLWALGSCCVGLLLMFLEWGLDIV